MFTLKQRVHPTWMLTAICAGILLGVALAQRIAWVPVSFAIIGALAATISLLQYRIWMFALALAGGVLIGAWRGGAEMGSLEAYGNVIGRSAIITGSVSADPQAVNRGGQAVVLTNVISSGQKLSGKVYVTVGETPKLRRDDVISINGLVAAGRGNYAAAMYDAIIVGIERPKNLALDARDEFNAATHKVLTEPAASLGVGILVGQKTELPIDFTDALKIAGLTHIVVASGYNLTILVRFARRVFSKISRYQAALWSVVLIAVFMAVAGWSASMTRAGLVACLSLWAWYYGRKFHPVTLLLFAASVTAMVYPPYAWGDVGWALSFMAFAGVIILAPLLTAFFYGEKKVGFAGQIIIETIAAQIATLPIMLGVFGQLSVVALLSNVMILPCIPLAMLLTFLAGVTQMLLPAVDIVGGFAQMLLDYIVWAVNWTASFPWALIKWQLPVWGVVVCYGALAIICLYLKRITRYELRKVNIVE